MPESKDFAIQVTSEDPKKKAKEVDDKDKEGSSSKLKDDPKPGEGEELVRVNLQFGDQLRW